MFRKISILMLLASSVSFGAHYHPPHTDGIEPYYQPKDFAKWVETVPEDLRLYLSASNPEKMQQLIQKLRRWEKEVGAPTLTRNPDYNLK